MWRGVMKIAMCRVIYVFFILMLTSCSVPLTCEFYNRTGAPLGIKKYGSGKVVQVALIENRSSYSFNECIYGDYQVEIGGKPYGFEIPSYSIAEEKYVKYKGTLFWGKRVVRAQIEPSGEIYLLQKGDEFPVVDLPTQPEGYPIMVVK